MRTSAPESTTVDNLRITAARAWDHEPQVVAAEGRLIDLIRSALRGSAKYFKGARRRELWGAILNGQRMRLQGADIMRIFLAADGSREAAEAADLVLIYLATIRHSAVIPQGSTNDRRHQAPRRGAERRRA